MPTRSIVTAPARLPWQRPKSALPWCISPPDYVFDGRSSLPINEEAPTGPLNVYGQSKLAGEKLVRKNCPDALIVRTSWLFSPFGSNFVRAVCASPRMGMNCALSTIRLAVRQAPSTWPRCWSTSRSGGWEVTELALAKPIISREGNIAAGRISPAASSIPAGSSAGSRRTVVPIATEDYPTPATRPAYTVLDCGRFDRDFGFERSGWRDAVRPVVAELMGAA